MRNDTAAACHADLPRRDANPRDDAVPAASSAAATTAAGNDDLPGWNDGAGRRDLPNSSAAAPAAPARRRTRLDLTRTLDGVLLTVRAAGTFKVSAARLLGSGSGW